MIVVKFNILKTPSLQCLLKPPVCFAFSETSELLAYDAAQAQNVEKVRRRCHLFWMLFSPPPRLPRNLFSYFCRQTAYFALCMPSTGSRGHRVFEVWQRAVAGAGWRHLPPHEDPVSRRLVVSTLKCKFTRKEEQQHITTSASVCQALTLFFFSLFHSVENKHKVADLAHIPKFLPEITIGAHEFDEKYYAYKSVRRDEDFHSHLPVWCGACACISISTSCPHVQYTFIYGTPLLSCTCGAIIY